MNQQVLHIISKRKGLVVNQGISSTGLWISPSHHSFSHWEILNVIKSAMESFDFTGLTSQKYSAEVIAAINGISSIIQLILFYWSNVSCWK